MFTIETYRKQNKLNTTKSKMADNQEESKRAKTESMKERTHFSAGLRDGMHGYRSTHHNENSKIITVETVETYKGDENSDFDSSNSSILSENIAEEAS